MSYFNAGEHKLGSGSGPCLYADGETVEKGVGAGVSLNLGIQGRRRMQRRDLKTECFRVIRGVGCSRLQENTGWVISLLVGFEI